MSLLAKILKFSAERSLKVIQAHCQASLAAYGTGDAKGKQLKFYFYNVTGKARQSDNTETSVTSNGKVYECLPLAVKY